MVSSPGFILPSLRVFEEAVSLLRERYPGDNIAWRGDGRKLALQAVESARWALRYAGGTPAERGLSAGATLFFEILLLHPLLDGNKRLATLVLDAYLIRNCLPRPRLIYPAALEIARGAWSLEDTVAWLLSEASR